MPCLFRMDIGRLRLNTVAAAKAFFEALSERFPRRPSCPHPKNLKKATAGRNKYANLHAYHFNNLESLCWQGRHIYTSTT